jgi:hypothetical protein
VNICEQECRFVTTDTDTGILWLEVVSLLCKKCCNKLKYFIVMIYLTETFYHSCGIGNDLFSPNILNIRLFHFTTIKEEHISSSIVCCHIRMLNTEKLKLIH